MSENTTSSPLTSAQKIAAYTQLAKQVAAALVSMSMVEAIWNKLGAEVAGELVHSATGLEGTSESIEVLASYLEAFVESDGIAWARGELSQIFDALSRATHGK